MRADQLAITAMLYGAYDGFAFEFASPGVRGGTRRRRLLVVARSPLEASVIARRFIPGVRYKGRGPKVLARARELGVEDGGAKVDGVRP